MYKIKFLQNCTWSMDGFNPQDYKKGQSMAVNERNYKLLVQNAFVELCDCKKSVGPTENKMVDLDTKTKKNSVLGLFSKKKK